MCLSHEDAMLFYNLFYGLLNYVNATYKVNPALSELKAEEQYNPNETKKVIDYLWEHPTLIDEYLARNTSLNEEEREIVGSWKRYIKGSFVLLRHLKKGSILLGPKSNAYLVKGIMTDFEEMFWYQPLPVMMEMVLLPFKGDIVYDTLARTYQITFGGGMKKSLNSEYSEAKKAGRFFTSL